MPPMLQVVRPLNVLGVQKLLEVAKQFYDNNFYLAISGAVMALHCQEVININDECPIVMCYSSSCGTGNDSNIL